MSEWRDISTAPKDGTEVLVCLGEITCVATWNLWDGEEAWRDHYGFHFSPTHWMPLPAPPITEQRSEAGSAE